MIAHLHGINRIRRQRPPHRQRRQRRLGLRRLRPGCMRATAARHRQASSICSRTSTSAKTEWTLYGFPSQEELELFELLIGVSGVGARTALAVLGAASPEQLRSAIAHEQTEVLTRVPGIGPKTAKAIIFHLKDKVGVVTAGAHIAYLTDADTEVIAALTGTGLQHRRGADARWPACRAMRRRMWKNGFGWR